jgi:hypothetical protein
MGSPFPYKGKSMNILDKFMSFLGYEKKAQWKPNSYLENELIPVDNERERLLDRKKDELVTDQINSGYPEVLSGNPAKPNSPEVDVNQKQKENTTDATPYNTDLPVNHTAPEHLIDITEKQLKPNRIINVDEVDQLNHAIAIKMAKMGIKSLDREMFLTKFAEIARKASLARKPISDYIDNVL